MSDLNRIFGVPEGDPPIPSEMFLQALPEALRDLLAEGCGSITVTMGREAAEGLAERVARTFPPHTADDDRRPMSDGPAGSGRAP